MYPPKHMDEKQGLVPIIIAMKGHPGTGKSKLAHALATALHCPLIDKDDVRDATACATAMKVDPKLLNNLSYDAIWRVAATQLRLGLSVVIDSPLSHRARLDRVCELAGASGARVVVVECRPKDEEEWRRRLEQRGSGGGDDGSWHKPATWEELERLLEGYGGCWDYDVGDVPKVVVDTTAAVEFVEIVSDVLEFIGTDCRLERKYKRNIDACSYADEFSRNMIFARSQAGV